MLLIRSAEEGDIDLTDRTNGSSVWKRSPAPKGCDLGPKSGPLSWLCPVRVPLIWALMRGDDVGWLVWMATAAAFCPLNQWLVRRKCLDHRPWFVPSMWGPVGTLIIVMAHPIGWQSRARHRPG